MPTAQPAAPDPVLASLEGSAGVLTLDRPAALNALTTPMIESIGRALDGFGRDPGVRTVLLRGSTPRAFCAGGDMRRIRELCLAVSDGKQMRELRQASSQSDGGAGESVQRRSRRAQFRRDGAEDERPTGSTSDAAAATN